MPLGRCSGTGCMHSRTRSGRDPALPVIMGLTNANAIASTAFALCSVHRQGHENLTHGEGALLLECAGKCI